MTKDKRIKQEFDKLSELYKDLPANKRKLCEKLIQNAAFMSATLEDLQKQVNEEGAIITSTNGNGFEVCTEHPAQKSYNTMINRYAAVISKLTELLPAQKAESKLEGLFTD